MKILLVDDSSTMRRIIKNSLNRLGYNDLLEAENGIVAWDILEENKDVKLIITDWNMPNRNGLELVKLIRSSEIHKEKPIIMINTEGGKKGVITALKKLELIIISLNHSPLMY